MGTFGIQNAKYYGAEVTAVDSTRKLEMMKSIGAEIILSTSGFYRQIYMQMVYDSVNTKSYRSVRTKWWE
ncbi:hypothetical protein EU528_12000 [Candidatus Thorarchaeota archaeon]|nr:MAG: hypothetical protein EU528_12000 [Candidatus Thorarchaeota archaeon]